MEQEQIEKIIEEYLKSHPKLIANIILYIKDNNIIPGFHRAF